MEQVIEQPYDLPNDEKTVLDRLYKKHGSPCQPENIVKILLAASEAERDINQRLDVLRDPSASTYKKTKARKFLREHAEEYVELCKQRDKLAGMIRTTKL